MGRSKDKKLNTGMLEQWNNGILEDQCAEIETME